ncbi:MAG TPA: carboxypeptidase regulatory-like domain-containing protein [Bryobacteraceae bacterium]|nr:carboxypeptidase regulatory-like domain-containing protein [Bryobacteraceae bacterium]
MNKTMTVAAKWFAMVCILALAAFAQSDNSSISGIVKDPSGAVVTGANITVTNEGTGFERKTTTNESGFYTITNIQPGFYKLSVEATGFKKYEKTRNRLEAALPIQVNVDLTVGQVSESVTVEATAAQLNTESAAVGKTVEQAQIQNLALNGRNPLFLAVLKPGVRRGSPMNGFSYGLDSGGLTINGGRSQDSLITFDGAVGIRTRANGTSVGTADLDTVQEVQVLTANYSAEYGRSSAGQIRMVTKSGGKSFHGSAYEYFRNNNLDANSWNRNRRTSTNFVAPLKFNQFGYNINGPVTIPGVFNESREKLFFLFAQEYVRRRWEDTLQARVPTNLMRTGDFGELLAPNIFYAFDPNNPTKNAIKDPDTGVPFANNVIPASRQSANGMAFLKAYYPSNGSYGTNNWLKVNPGRQNQRKDTISLDFNPTMNQFIKFRLANYSYTGLDTSRGGFDYAITDWDRPNRTASLGHTWTLGPTMINEFLVSGSVDRVRIGIDRTGERYLRSRPGINYPYIYPERKEIYDKVPTIEIPNLGTIDGGPYPSSSAGPIYQVSNNFTKIYNNHTFKFGALWERSGQNDFDQINVSGVPGGTNNQNGRFIFQDSRSGATSTGIGMANAAMGLFSTYAEIGPRAYTPYRSHMFEFFAQDSWRVNSKLKLELGLRATWQNGYYKSLWGNIAIFDAKKYDPAKAAVIDRDTGYVLAGDRFNGVVIPGSKFPEAGRGRVAAIDSGLYDRLLSGGSEYPADNQLNWMPRLGLAYSISSKDVLRLGAGGFASRPGVYDNAFLGGNPPFQPMVSITNGSADNPGGGSNNAFPQYFQTVDPAYKIPVSYNWNASYQRQITGDTTVEVGYIGTTGLYLARSRDLNQLKTGTMFLPANIGAKQAFLRPYRGFADIAMTEHSGRSTYNALQFEVNRRFTKGFMYGFAYTYGKTMDNNSTLRQVFIDSYNPQLNWGKSDNDVRHVAVINYVWELPFFNNAGSRLVKAVAGGWQISGVVQFQTGAPFTITRTDDYLSTGAANDKPWNLNGTTDLPKKFANENAAGTYVGITDYYFNPKPNGSIWATKPANGTLPNQNRNSIDFNNVGFQNWNIAMFKSFKFTESQAIQFRFEAFNFPNHPNWSGFDTNPTSTSFGMNTGKSSERNVQLSLRYSF